MEDFDHEQFHIVLLNNNLKLIKTCFISKGTETETVVSIKEILKQTIENKAKRIIVIHNHPSGGIEPSNADINLTKKMKDAVTLIDSSLIDHVIIGKGRYYSFADEGTL
jgi:DNA repair protein RadC